MHSLKNKNPTLYRIWEIVPGFFAWSLILFPIWGVFVVPRFVAYFVIAFLVYWLYQSCKASILSLIGFQKIKISQKQNWQTTYQSNQSTLSLPYDSIKHVVFVVSYKEPLEVIDMALHSLASQVDLDLKHLFVVLAQEQRAGADNNQKTQKYFEQKYSSTFGKLLFTEHPGDLPGETKGKHSNEAWAAKWFYQNYIATKKYDLDHLTLTTCDVDTIFHPKYFSALRYYFAKSPDRYVKFWQTPIFWHNNINSVPSPIRIIGTLGNVIHIANIQEPDGLFFNYSCYSASYKLIHSVGYWDVDVIPEDWHIFLQSFFGTGGKSYVEPIFLPTVVDAPTGDTYWQALKNRYTQSVRHAWGATDIPYALEQARQHPEIPLLVRMSRIFKLIETHIIWSSNWFILTLGTSLPVILNPSFFQTTIGYNLPRISNIILTICLAPLILLIWLDWQLRPPAAKKGLGAVLKNLLQWPLMPLATLTMSVLPGLHSHTKLMFGKGLEYKTTIKK